MARLIYTAISSVDGFVADTTASSTGPSPTRKCTPSSTTSSARGYHLDGRRLYEVLVLGGDQDRDQPQST